MLYRKPNGRGPEVVKPNGRGPEVEMKHLVPTVVPTVL
jgi:hypothetical protein